MTALQPLIHSRILTLREQRVMLDADLAQLYSLETRVLVQAVKRNLARFPEDFMFQLFDALRSLMTPPEPPKRPIGFVTPLRSGQGEEDSRLCEKQDLMPFTPTFALGSVAQGVVSRHMRTC